MRTGGILGFGLELKRAYRKNMALGFGFSSAIAVIFAAVILLLSPREIPGDNIRTIAPRPPLPPPIRIDQGPGPIVGPSGPKNPQPKIGIPVPVPEEQVSDDVLYPRQMDLYLRVPYEPGEERDLAAMGFGADKILEDILPSPDTIIFYEEPPILVKSVSPFYPDLARRAGIEGHVWLKVLIDREGAVRDVLVEADSNRNAGFGESAVAAARKCVWRPAIANGQPVAVWITYKIVFKLEK